MKPSAPPPQPDTLAQEFREFVYTVSHDLNTPLRGIVEFSRLLKDEQSDRLDAEGKEYLALIMESGEKMQKMLSGLLDYSRLNTMSKPFANVSCNKVVSDCLLVLREKIGAARATMDIADLPCVRADAEQLMQLLLMLLENALTFHSAGALPHVTVSGSEQADYWELTVRDNGIGIEPEFHRRIFQPFQKLHADNEYPGIGMGLALARKIVARHGGKIYTPLF